MNNAEAAQKIIEIARYHSRESVEAFLDRYESQVRADERAKVWREVAEKFRTEVVAHGVGSSKDSWVPKEPTNRVNDFVVNWAETCAAAPVPAKGVGDRG